MREDDPYFNTLLRLQATRCMSTAKYCSTGSLPRNELYHYGLASPLYTHFTSPIRRYADVIVHRLFSASLGLISIDEVLISSVGKKLPSTTRIASPKRLRKRATRDIWQVNKLAERQQSSTL